MSEMIERVAKAIEEAMFAPHELPLSEGLHRKFLDPAREAVAAYIAVLSEAGYVIVPREPTEAMVQRVARALMAVRAKRPAQLDDDREFPVLSLDPDFDDLPLDHTQGTEDDEITQEAVLCLARAALDEALR